MARAQTKKFPVCSPLSGSQGLLAKHLSLISNDLPMWLDAHTPRKEHDSAEACQGGGILILHIQGHHTGKNQVGVSLMLTKCLFFTGLPPPPRPNEDASGSNSRWFSSWTKR